MACQLPLLLRRIWLAMAVQQLLHEFQLRLLLPWHRPLLVKGVAYQLPLLLRRRIWMAMAMAVQQLRHEFQLRLLLPWRRLRLV